MSEVTRILSAIEEGDAHAAVQLLPLVYDELRQLAAQRLAQEKPGQTLQATALVHEAYLRLVDVDKASTSAIRCSLCRTPWNASHFMIVKGSPGIIPERALAWGLRRAVLPVPGGPSRNPSCSFPSAS